MEQIFFEQFLKEKLALKRKGCVMTLSLYDKTYNYYWYHISFVCMYNE